MSRGEEQAFPIQSVVGLPNGNVEWGASGLTIREHYAALALPAVVSACAKDTLKAGELIDELFARKAYRLADAMIAEGAKPAVNRLATLIAAVTQLLPSIEDEIDQRKLGGNDEDWRPLQQLLDSVREALP